VLSAEPFGDGGGFGVGGMSVGDGARCKHRFFLFNTFCIFFEALSRRTCCKSMGQNGALPERALAGKPPAAFN
jgi:hypothetical protein